MPLLPCCMTKGLLDQFGNGKTLDALTTSTRLATKLTPRCIACQVERFVKSSVENRKHDTIDGTSQTRQTN
eukprot:2086708-Amphidinium_carterae.2